VPDREIAVDGRPIYLWTIPPKRPVGPPPEPLGGTARLC
jgi:hypothetical protein